MARFGTNLKIMIAAEHRPAVRGIFVDVLEASASQPNDGLEVYRMSDGSNVGVFYVPAGEALDAASHRKATWLEFLVEDPDAVAGKLQSRASRIDYTDKTHAYFQLPGGPVFRLARA